MVAVGIGNADATTGIGCTGPSRTGCCAAGGRSSPHPVANSAATTPAPNHTPIPTRNIPLLFSTTTSH